MSLQKQRSQRKKKVGKDDIKNYDRDGPEGQSKTTGSTMCNAGQSPWYPCFLIQGYPIKVSMRKKRKRKGIRNGQSGRKFIGVGPWSVHVCNFQRRGMSEWNIPETEEVGPSQLPVGSTAPSATVRASEGVGSWAVRTGSKTAPQFDSSLWKGTRPRQVGPVSKATKVEDRKRRVRLVFPSSSRARDTPIRSGRP